MSTENLLNLKIHKVSQEYLADNEGSLDRTALYLTPDEPKPAFGTIKVTDDDSTSATDESDTLTIKGSGATVVNIAEKAVTIYSPEFVTVGQKSECVDNLGEYTTVEGANNNAQGNYSHVEGLWNENSLDSQYSSVVEKYSYTCDYSHVEGYFNIAYYANQHVQGHFNSPKGVIFDNNLNAQSGLTGTAGTAFIIGNGTGSDLENRSNAFRVDYDGKVYAWAPLHTSGADYAEYFEWFDANPAEEDRRGYFVTLDGEKIKFAGPNDYILGIISGLPAVLGNGDEDWRGRYIYDDFGSFIEEKFTYEDKLVDPETKEEKVVIRTGTRYKQSPDYDPVKPYIPRADRPEWDAVGMMGVLSVRDDGTCQVNGYCTVADGGIATASDTGYRVIKRVNDHIVKVVFR